MRRLWILALLAPLGCEGATAVTVDVSTDIPCTAATKLSTAIAAGTPADYQTRGASAATTRCDPDGKIGTLVLVPSGADDEDLAVEVVMTNVAKDPMACRTNPTGCIIARRVLRFVPHETLALPIVLHADCLGLSSTCEDGISDGGVIDAADAALPTTPPVVPPTMPPPVPDAGKGHGGGPGK